MHVDAVYFVQLTVNGLIQGLLYGLIAVGLALIFGVLELINFAHGEFLMLGAYTMTFALPALGLAYGPSMAAAIAVAGLFGLLIYELILHRLRSGEFERSILVTLALSIIIQHVVQYLFTANPRIVETQFGFSGWTIGAIRITFIRITAAGAALAAFTFLYVVLKHTQFGRSMRAVAQNREAALMVGVRPKTVARNAVVLATALCGLAGAALAPIQLVTPIMGQYLIFKAFALIVIGGLGALSGVFIASIGLGLLESWVGGFFEMVWQESAVFVVMIVVLLLRPDGIFKQGRVRAG
jgi:branched-chain amino acid transport system permease protein